MLVVFARTFIMYLVVLFVIRIMGKAELSKMSPFQLVVIFMIAELASIPIESPEISMIKGTAAIFTLMFIQVLISYLSLKHEKIKCFFRGKPSLLINKGEINTQEMKSLRITIDDLMEQLRIGNASSISEVEYAIMEANGDLSIIQKAENKPLTPKDMNIKKATEIMPSVFIADGVLYNSNLSASGRDEQKLTEELNALGFENISDVFLAVCDSNGKLHAFAKRTASPFAKEVIK